MSIRVWCPRCGQGWVGRWRLPGGQPLWACDECEGVWFGDEVVPVPESDVELLRPGAQWLSLEPVDERLVEVSPELGEPVEGSA